MARIRPRRTPDVMRAQVVVDGVQFPVDGASVAIVENGRVFVQFRPFPPGWELPGGHVESDENPIEAAIREVSEETGWEVHIRGLVGVYSWRGLRSVGDAVYLGEIVGGKRRRSLESVAGAWVAPGHMPRTLFPWCRQRIYDALARVDGDDPVHRVQDITPIHVAGFAVSWLRFPYDAALRKRKH